MAAGDIVNGIQAVGATLNFQPSAGTEIMLSSITGWGNFVYLTDGVLSSELGVVSALQLPNEMCGKWFINNTNYFQNSGSGGVSKGYTGIQIK